MLLLFSLPGSFSLLILAAAVLFTVVIFYILTLQKLLRSISPENRLVAPATPCVLLFPFLGFVFHIILVFTLAASIRKEAAARGLTTDEKYPGLLLGIAMCVCSGLEFVPQSKLIAGIAGLICFILYWVKMAGWVRTFETGEVLLP